MRILVIGSGGREHALVWKLKQSARTEGAVLRPRQRRDRAACPVPCGAAARLGRHPVAGPRAPDRHGRRRSGGPAGRRSRGQAVGRGGASTRARCPGGAARVEQGVLPRSSWRETGFRPQASASTTPPNRRWPGWTPRKRVTPSWSKPTAWPPEKAWSWRATATRRATPCGACSCAREFGTAGDRVILEEFLAGTEASYIVFTDGEHDSTRPSRPGITRPRSTATPARTRGAWAPIPATRSSIPASSRPFSKPSSGPRSTACAPRARRSGGCSTPG